MAQLPKVRDNLALTQAPRSALSGADIANPFQQVAEVFGAAGIIAEKDAVAEAGRAGQAGVTRDETGSIRVAENPFGRHGARADAYDRAAHQGYLARFSVDARTTASRLAQEAGGDVSKFDEAWKGFVDKAIPGVPRELRGSVKEMLDVEGTQFSAGVTAKKRDRDLQVAKADIEAARDMYADDLAALARAGGTQTGEYRDKFAKVSVLLHELADNPDLNYSREQAALELKRIESRNIGEAMVGQVERELERGGGRAARETADKILSDTELALSPGERRSYHGLMKARIAEHSAAVGVAVDALKDRKRDFEKSFGLGRSLDDRDVDETAIALIEAGKPAEASELLQRRNAARIIARVTAPGASPADRVSALERAKQGGAAAPPRQRGDRVLGGTATQQAAQLMRGFEKFRSSPYWDVNANRIGFGSDTVTWADGRVEEVKPGMRVTRADAERDLARRLGEFEATARGDVGGEAWDRLPEGVKAGLLSVTYNYGEVPGRIRDAVRSGDSAAIAEAVRGLSPDNGGINAKRRAQEAAVIEGAQSVAVVDRTGDYSGFDADLVEELQATVTDDIRNLWPVMKAGIERGEMPAGPEVAQLGQQLALINDAGLKSEILSYFENHDRAAEMLEPVPPAERESFIASARAAAGADGYSVAEIRLFEELERQETARVSALKSDPIGWSMQRNPNAVGVVPLDFSGGATTLARGFAARQAHVDLLEHSGEVSSAPALRPGDEKSIAQVWQSGTPEQIRSLTEGMAASLKPTTLAATLAADGVRDAIKGAALSVNPARHAEAMRQLDVMEAGAGIFEVERAYGKEAVDRLQDWQARLRYFSEPEAAAWLRERSDPAWSERMKPNRATGMKEARSLSDADIMAGLGVGGFFGSEAAADELTVQMLRSDFEAVFADRYVATQDAATAKSQAFKRMERHWGASDANGGRLMFLPPEEHLPEVGGSRAWIADDFAAVALEHRFDPANASIVADRKTETAIQRNETPGYLISVRDPETGLEDLLQDGQNRPLRWFPDAAKAKEEANAAFRSDREQYRPVSRDEALDAYLWGEQAGGGGVAAGR